MPLAPDTLLTPNFAASELGASDPTASDAVVANLYSVAAWLQAARGVLGVPLVVTSGYRSWEHNTAIGGDPHSDHPNGLAADFEPQGMTPYEAFTKLKAADDAGELPAFDQIIFYALDNHIHVGLGTGLRHEWLFHTTEGSYVALAENVVTQLRGFV